MRLTAEPMLDRISMYIGFSDADGRERHVSLVPYVPGLEAMCGQQLRTTRRGLWRAVVSAATCRTCGVRGVEVAHRALDGR